MRIVATCTSALPPRISLNAFRPSMFPSGCLHSTCPADQEKKTPGTLVGKSHLMISTALCCPNMRCPLHPANLVYRRAALTSRGRCIFGHIFFHGTVTLITERRHTNTMLTTKIVQKSVAHSLQKALCARPCVSPLPLNTASAQGLCRRHVRKGCGRHLLKNRLVSPRRALRKGPCGSQLPRENCICARLCFRSSAQGSAQGLRKTPRTVRARRCTFCSMKGCTYIYESIMPTRLQPAHRTRARKRLRSRTFMPDMRAICSATSTTRPGSAREASEGSPGAPCEGSGEGPGPCWAGAAGGCKPEIHFMTPRLHKVL